MLCSHCRFTDKFPSFNYLTPPPPPSPPSPLHQCHRQMFFQLANRKIDQKSVNNSRVCAVVNQNKRPNAIINCYCRTASPTMDTPIEWNDIALKEIQCVIRTQSTASAEKKTVFPWTCLCDCLRKHNEKPASVLVVGVRVWVERTYRYSSSNVEWTKNWFSSKIKKRGKVPLPQKKIGWSLNEKHVDHVIIAWKISWNVLSTRLTQNHRAHSIDGMLYYEATLLRLLSLDVCCNPN